VIVHARGRQGILRPWGGCVIVHARSKRHAEALQRERYGFPMSQGIGSRLWWRFVAVCRLWCL